MSAKVKVLCFAGSLRADSVNKKLAKVAVAAAKKHNVEVAFLDLKDYPLPIYDGDIEAQSGVPENALKLKALLKSHDAFIISSPEYNSSITAALKNMIDWASRPMENEKQLECFMGKVVGLMSASPGALGGLRGLVTVRSIFSNIGSIVVPTQHSISQAFEQFNEDGSLKDAKHQRGIESVVNQTVSVAGALVAERSVTAQ